MLSFLAHTFDILFLPTPNHISVSRALSVIPSNSLIHGCEPPIMSDGICRTMTSFRGRPSIDVLSHKQRVRLLRTRRKARQPLHSPTYQWPFSIFLLYPLLMSGRHRLVENSANVRADAYITTRHGDEECNHYSPISQRKPGVVVTSRSVCSSRKNTEWGHLLHVEYKCEHA